MEVVARRREPSQHRAQVLELARESLIEVTQQEAYAPIYVKLRGGETAVVE